MTEISPKIHLVVKDFDLDLVEKAAYDITLVPSFVVLDSKLLPKVLNLMEFLRDMKLIHLLVH